MAIFTIVRNGQTYKLNGPPGSTEAQATAVLEAQLLSGTLVGQPVGTVLDLKYQVANGLNLVGIQLESSRVNAADQLPASLPPNTIGISDINLQKSGEPVGTLDGEQVRGLLAQKAKQVNQGLTDVSNDKGIGQYGLTLPQLEQAGFIKPGTSNLLATGVALADIVANPAVWTGKDNMVNLAVFGASAAAQQTAQQLVYNQAFSALTAQGLLPANILPQDLGAVLNTAATFNVETAANWLQGQLSQETQAAINAVARAGEFATSISQVATLAGQGSLSSAVMLAGSALGVSGVGLAQATSALSLFEVVYNGPGAIGEALRTSFGSYGQTLSQQFGLGGSLQQSLSELASVPGQVVNQVLNGIQNVGVTIGGELSSALSSLGGFSGLGNLSSAVGSNQIFDGFGSLATDAFATQIPGLFDITRVDALGNEYVINLFSELRLEAAGFLDSAGSLFGIQNLGNSLFGSFSSISGVLDALGPISAGIKVFTSFFGGGGRGDGSGLNFSLDSVPRPVPVFQNCYNRVTCDAAVTRIIGDARCTNINFGAVSNSILAPIRVDATGIAAARLLIGQVQAQAARQQAQIAFVEAG
jgi:hypothetical protein